MIMTRHAFTVTLVLAAGLLMVAPTTGAEEGQTPLNPELELFARQFRAAAQSQDVTRMRALSHSESQACVEAGDSEYYDRIIEWEVGTRVRELICDPSHRPLPTFTLAESRTRRRLTATNRVRL